MTGILNKIINLPVVINSRMTARTQIAETRRSQRRRDSSFRMYRGSPELIRDPNFRIMSCKSSRFTLCFANVSRRERVRLRRRSKARRRANRARVCFLPFHGQLIDHLTERYASLTAPPWQPFSKNLSQRPSSSRDRDRDDDRNLMDFPSRCKPQNRNRQTVKLHRGQVDGTGSKDR